MSQSHRMLTNLTAKLNLWFHISCIIYLIKSPQKCSKEFFRRNKLAIIRRSDSNVLIKTRLKYDNCQHITLVIFHQQELIQNSKILYRLSFGAKEWIFSSVVYKKVDMFWMPKRSHDRLFLAYKIRGSS